MQEAHMVISLLTKQRVTELSDWSNVLNKYFSPTYLRTAVSFPAFVQLMACLLLKKNCWKKKKNLENRLETPWAISNLFGNKSSILAFCSVLVWFWSHLFWPKMISCHISYSFLWWSAYSSKSRAVMTNLLETECPKNAPSRPQGYPPPPHPTADWPGGPAAP